jgi:hypothetical protein
VVSGLPVLTARDAGLTPRRMLSSDSEMATNNPLLMNHHTQRIIADLSYAIFEREGPFSEESLATAD